MPDLKINWHGVLIWGVPTNIDESRIQKLSRQQIIKIEPNLKEYPEEAIYEHEVGVVDPILTTKLLTEKAEENGRIYFLVRK
ncbi:hypothetical protein [Paenibacillus xylanivorans]|uniref:hypothetical protein n=1 Tax=Paenibacillus xylanivorans TaxID=1705561 RepID=UPI0006B20BF0|nr:hypothetical protein [Paenibacillus xylanivorans]